MREVLTFILAGGKGERLNPLTRDRAKPAVPFGGIYRIIDFTLSNCINSGLRRIFVLIQYKSFSLQKHLLSGWDVFSSQLGEFIDAIPPQQRVSTEWYKGTADAIYQNLNAIQDNSPELVLILAGDHIYKMDYMRMIRRHKEKGADMTVACIRAPREESTRFGVIEVDQQESVVGFQEKPAAPRTIPDDSGKVYASMGIYLFSRDILLEALENDARVKSSHHDFGKDIIPRMLANNRKIFVHNFVDDKGQAKYWRDIGTRDAYFEANMDLLGDKPEFDLYDRSWPVRTYHAQFPPAKIVDAKAGRKRIAGRLVDSILAQGCIIKGAEIRRSILSSNVRVQPNAVVENSVIMESVMVGENAHIRNAIIDKEVMIPPDTRIGFDLDLDRKRFAVTSSGIVIVAKKTPV